MSEAITRPNGKLYRPRKAPEAFVSWNEDGPVWLLVFGTHDVAVAEPLALAKLAQVNDPDYDVYSDGAYEAVRRGNPDLTWIGTEPGYDRDEEKFQRFYKVDPEKGRAAVCWVLDEQEVTDRVEAGCPACREHLGWFRAEGEFTAEWWADKAVFEHMGEKHD